MKYLAGRAWKVELVVPGAKLELRKRFRAILVYCKDARPNDPCAANVTLG